MTTQATINFNDITNTFQLGQLVKYKGEYAIVTMVYQVRQQVQMLFPQKGNHKLVVSIFNKELETVCKQVPIVKYRNKPYYVTDKGTIISHMTKRVMKWDDNNGDRKAILELADRHNQFLFEEVDDFIITYAEEDSWWKAQDIVTWTTEDLQYYYTKYVQQQEKPMNNINEVPKVIADCWGHGVKSYDDLVNWCFEKEVKEVMRKDRISVETFNKGLKVWDEQYANDMNEMPEEGVDTDDEFKGETDMYIVEQIKDIIINEQGKLIADVDAGTINPEEVQDLFDWLQDIIDADWTEPSDYSGKCFSDLDAGTICNENDYWMEIAQKITDLGEGHE